MSEQHSPPPGSLPQGAEYHQKLAKDWDDRYKNGGFSRRAELFSTVIAPELSCQGRRWLDVGCGSGYFSRLLARQGAHVVGIDASPEMIKVARLLAIRDGLNGLEFQVVSTAETLNHPDGSFDGCLCLSVLEYLGDPERCFAEMARVLRPGGCVVGSFANERSFVRKGQDIIRSFVKRFGSRTGFEYLETSQRTWCRADIEALAERHELKCEFLIGFDPIFPAAVERFVPPSLYYMVARKPW